MKKSTVKKKLVSKPATKKSTKVRAVAKKVAARASVKPKASDAKTKSVKPVSAKKVKAGKAIPLAERRRRMILVDVENTSSEDRLRGVLDHLDIDRRAAVTDLVAIGNWKAVGSRTARLLARSGAQLMHSAPATGVRDWSDLWIAVAAGRWIATARPGDQLDIVSDDHAFDAVADAASATGVEFHRISYRTLNNEPEPVVAEMPSERSDGLPPRRRRRGGRRRKSGASEATILGLPATSGEGATPPPSVRSADGTHANRTHGHATGGDAGHPATPENIRAAVARLTNGDHEKWVNLDLVGNALRAQGFTRPPGSPRLVTRVRKVEEIEVSPTGMVRLRPTTTAVAAPEAAREESSAAPSKAPARRRSRARKPKPAATEGSE